LNTTQKCHKQKGVDVNLHDVQCIGDLGTSIIIVAVLSTDIAMALIAALLVALKILR
jgi:hypothetical protein